MIELINGVDRCSECGWHVGVDGVSYWECDLCQKEFCDNCYLPNVDENDLWLCEYCWGDDETKI